MVLDQLKSAFSGRTIEVGPSTEERVDQSMRDTPNAPGPAIASTPIEIQDKLLEPSDRTTSKHHERLNRSLRIANLSAREDRYFALTMQLIQIFDDVGLVGFADRFDATMQAELGLTASRDGVGLKQFNTTTVEQKKQVTEVRPGQNKPWGT